MACSSHNASTHGRMGGKERRKIKMMDVADLRREYTRGGLHRADLPAEPLALFEKWLAQACEAKLTDPTAMVVGTVDVDGQPWQRTVLLKHYDAEGMVFYTNMGSRKAHQLEGNPRISLLFPWHTLDRQVHVTGRVEKMSTFEVMKYFHSRPKDSQIAAWVSQQSTRISARGVLEAKFPRAQAEVCQWRSAAAEFLGRFSGADRHGRILAGGRTSPARSFLLHPRGGRLAHRAAGALSARCR